MDYKKNKQIVDNVLLSMDLIFDINRSYQWEIAQKHKLTPLQIRILQIVDQQSNDGNIIVKKLTEKLYLSKATISVAISTLVKKNLIYKIKSDKDQRIYFLKLTEKGKQIINEINAQRQLIIKELKRIDKSILKNFYQFAIEYIKIFQKLDLIDYPAMCPFCANSKLLNKNDMIFKCNLTGKILKLEDIEFDCFNYKAG